MATPFYRRGWFLAVTAVVALALLRLAGSDAGWLVGLQGWITAALFVGLQVLTGVGLLRLSGVSRLDGISRLEVGVLAGCAGYFVNSLLLGLLTAVGCTVWFAAIAPALAIVVLIVAPGASWQQSAEPGTRGVRAAVIAGALVFLAPYFVQTLLPDADWDSAMYHLPMASAFLEQGLWTDAYVSSALYRPGVVQLAYAFLFTIDAQAAILPLNFLTVLGTAAAVLALARNLAGTWAAVLAVLVFAGVNLLFEIGLDARVDAALVFFVVAGTLALLLWQRAPQQRALALLAVMAASLALGTKYNGALLAGLLLAASAVLGLRKSVDRKMGTVAVAAVLMLPGGFWYARNAALFGDPVYPFRAGPMYRDAEGKLTRRELGPLIPKSAAPGPGAVAEVQRLGRKDGGATERKRAVAGPLLFFDAMLHRDKYTTKPYHWLSPFLALFLLLPLVARGPPALLLLALTIGGYLLVFLSTHELRYAAPLFPLMAASAGIVLAQARPRQARAAIVVALSALAGYHSLAEWGKVSAQQPGAYLVGEEDALQYLSHVGYNGEPAMPQFVRWFNTEIDGGRVARTDKVFMIGEAKGHLLACGYSPGEGSAGIEWLNELINAGWDYDQLAASLEARRFRWILLNKGWMEWMMKNRVARPTRLALTLHHLAAFLEAHGTTGKRPLIEFGPLMLFRMRD